MIIVTNVRSFEKVADPTKVIAFRKSGPTFYIKGCSSTNEQGQILWTLPNHDFPLSANEICKDTWADKLISAIGDCVAWTEDITDEYKFQLLKFTDANPTLIENMEDILSFPDGETYLVAPYKPDYMQVNVKSISLNARQKAIQVLIDHGIKAEESPEILQAVGEALIQTSIFPEEVTCALCTKTIRIVPNTRN